MIHLIDNTGALSALVHGYARKADLARLVNLFHLQTVGLRCTVWAEWVPSKANPADIPTRADRSAEMRATARWVDMVPLRSTRSRAIPPGGSAAFALPPPNGHDYVFVLFFVDLRWRPHPGGAAGPRAPSHACGAETGK